MMRLFPIVPFLAALGLFFGYVHPTYTGSISALNNEIKSYDAALAAADRFAEREAALSAERAAIPPEGLARLEALLPDGVDNVQLILDLDALASRSGLSLTDFDVATGGASTDPNSTAPAGAIAPGEGVELGGIDPVDSIDLAVTATGTYASLRTFLTGVERSLRLLDLVELTVEDSETGVYSYDMTFRLYWLR